MFQMNVRSVSSARRLRNQRSRMEFWRGAPDSGPDHRDAGGGEHGVECLAEGGIPVVHHEPDPYPRVVQVHQKIPGLLDYPFLVRVQGGTEDPYPPGGVLDRRQYVRLGSVQQVHDHEVAGQDRLGLGP